MYCLRNNVVPNESARRRVVFCLTPRSLVGPNGISLRGALDAGGP